MAFEITPEEFLKQTMKRNADLGSQTGTQDFNFGGGELFSTAKRKSREDDQSSLFSDIGGNNLGSDIGTKSLFEQPIDEIENTVKTIGLQDQLEVAKYGAQKKADEQARINALQRAQCQKAKKKNIWGSIGSVVGGIAMGRPDIAIAGGANLIGGSGSC
jgi:hypothetical protein